MKTLNRILLAAFVAFLLLPGFARAQTATATATPTATATATATPTAISTVTMPYPLSHQEQLQHFNAAWVKPAPGMYGFAVGTPAAAATAATATAAPPYSATYPLTLYVWGVGVSCTGATATGTFTVKGLNSSADLSFEIVGNNAPLFVPFFGAPASAAGQPVVASITSPAGETCTDYIEYFAD